MLGNQIYMSGFTPEELMSLFRDVIKEELDKLQTDKVERLLSPAETCKIFQPNISKTTLKSWTEQGYLFDHRIGGRVFYKLSEVLEKSKTLKRYKK
jgi:hypothetical protein